MEKLVYLKVKFNVCTSTSIIFSGINDSADVDNRKQQIAEFNSVSS